MKWLSLIVFWGPFHTASSQTLDMLAKLPKDSLINRAAKILSKEEGRFKLHLHDQVLIWMIPEATTSKSETDTSRAASSKLNSHLTVTLNQHTILMPEKRKKYIYGVSVDLSRGFIQCLGHNGLGVAPTNEFFIPTRKQRNQIKFVKEKINEDETLNRLYERSKDSGRLHILDNGTYYDVRIEISMGESYSFEIEKVTGETSEVSRKLIDHFNKPHRGPYRLY